MSNKREIEVVIAAKEMVSGMLGKAIAAIGGFAAVATTIYKSVEAASEAELVQAKLAAALGRTSEALDAQAKALQQTTKYEDDAVTAAQAMVAAFTKNEDQIKRVTAAAADFAAAKGIDLVSAAELVTKSVYGETNALGRYGITAEGAAGSTYRLEGMMRSLNQHFGGQAAAQADTFSGRLSQMKNAFSDLLESLGNLIVKNTFVIEAMKMFTGLLQQASQWLGDHRQQMLNLVKDGLVGFVTWMGYAVQIIQYFGNAWGWLKITINWVIAQLATGMVYLLDTMRETIFRPLDKLFDVLVKLGTIGTNPLKGLELGFIQFGLSAHDVLQQSLKDTSAWDKSFDPILAKIQMVRDALAATSAQTTLTPPTSGGADPEAERVLSIGAAWDSLAESATKAMSIHNANTLIMSQITKSAANVQNAAFKSMETQLLRLVETHRFSVGEFGKAVMQSVKIELIGIAARAAVWMLFEAAMGLAMLFVNPPAAAAHFASAAGFGLIAGATVAAAMGVNALSGSGAQQPGAGESPNNPVYTSGGVPAPSGAAGGSNYNVTVTVINPLGNENWDKLIEEQVVPALNRAGDRAITLNTNVLQPA